VKAGAEPSLRSRVGDASGASPRVRSSVAYPGHIGRRRSVLSQTRRTGRGACTQSAPSTRPGVRARWCSWFSRSFEVKKTDWIRYRIIPRGIGASSSLLREGRSTSVARRASASAENSRPTPLRRRPAGRRAARGGQAQSDLPLGRSAGARMESLGRAVGGAAEIESHAPKPARMGAAVSVAAGVGQLRAPHRLHRVSALLRDGARQDDRVGVTDVVGGEAAGSTTRSTRRGAVRAYGSPVVGAGLGNGGASLRAATARNSRSEEIRITVEIVGGCRTHHSEQRVEVGSIVALFSSNV
jgi:hypothetical protein